MKDKKHYILKSLPTRPTFPQDMTAEEREIMQQHITYWEDKAEKGIAIVFGPVFDPKGGYGLGVIEVDEEEQVHALIKDDPAVKAGLQKPEFYLMGAVLPKWWHRIEK
ncbi:YciI family protein [Clostridium cellulovorans]|uniref:YCII-related n=1 Tax=Clostridium cellulovorans (strain ATCC 35296 / DSM 3052 / OCM 3 / 743B) TaxID=573061 RepID=D9STZ1_CLOC7|nr:YciI family protein [Clostridium cellulovorans]ADL50829.1 YCII-related [Clostridium cellulovorans 743B]